MTKINFEVNKNDIKLKLEGNIDNTTLKELRKLINNKKIRHENSSSIDEEYNQSNNEFYDIEYKFRDISSKLRKNKDFQLLLPKLYEQYDEYCIESVRLQNILDVSLKNTKAHKEFKLNEKEFKKQVQNIYTNIRKNKVEFLLIHIAGLNNNEQISIIIDSISRELFNTPKKIIKSEYESDKTLIEVIFFGKNINKNYFDYSGN